MKKIILTIAVLIVGAAGIFIVTSKNEDTSSNNRAAEDVKQLVQHYSANRTVQASASINSHQLIVAVEGAKPVTYALPDDEFFVSIAPFKQKTHPCAIHSLTGCQGELVNEAFEVYIADTDGNEIIHQTMTTLSNGFIDLWLPRNRTYHVVIKQGNHIAESELSTFEGDNTCVTTMQLI